jgi:hypothetical protein
MNKHVIDYELTETSTALTDLSALEDCDELSDIEVVAPDAPPDTGRGASRYIRLKQDGKNRIRFLKIKGQPLFVVQYRHWAQVDGKKFPLLCLKAHGDGNCPMCDASAKLALSGDDTAARDIRASANYLLIAVDADAPEAGPRILGLNYTNFLSIFGRPEGWMQVPQQPGGIWENSGNMTLKSTGYDIIISSTKSPGGKTVYQCLPGRSGPIDPSWVVGFEMPVLLDELSPERAKPEDYVAAARAALGATAPARSQRSIGKR